MTSPEGYLPRISIVTPSFNQAQFLESTIRSVLGQAYPDLEYIVIDGASTDNSQDIIRRYEDQLTYWISEPDRGQSHAINKGFEMATGAVFGWLNSDDQYLPGALETVAKAYRANPGTIIAGSVITVDERPGRRLPDQVTRHAGLSFERLVGLGREPLAYHQPGLFFPASAWRSAHGLDETLAYTMDYDLLCRLLQVCPVTYVPTVVARFRLHGDSKTCSQWLAMVSEQVEIARRYAARAGLNNTRELEAYVIEGLVNQSATQMLTGHPYDSATFLVRAAREDLFLTARAIVGQVSAGIGRQAARRLLRQAEPHSS
jgi:glycosyltransferase involved in cell wall biosynthesis